MKWLSVTHNSPKWNPHWLWYSCIWAFPLIFTYILIHWLWRSFPLDFPSLPAFFSLTTNKNTLDFITRDSYVESIPSITVLIPPLPTSQEKKELFSTHIFPPPLFLPFPSLLSSFFLSFPPLPSSSSHSSSFVIHVSLKNEFSSIPINFLRPQIKWHLHCACYVPDCLLNTLHILAHLIIYTVWGSMPYCFFQRKKTEAWGGCIIWQQSR